MKNKILITLVLILTFVCLLAVGASAKDLYLEEIPDDLKIDGDTVTHFLVIDGEEYYGGSGATINLFNTGKIAEEIAKLEAQGGALNNLGYTANDLGTKFLTKLVIPDTFGGTTVTEVDINNNGAFKKQVYFTNCGYLEYPSSMTKTNDGNDYNKKIRCIDFGENSCLVQIPFYYMNGAASLIRLKNMPRNLTTIEESAFMGCTRLQGDENRQLYIGAATVKYKAFDCAMANVKSLIFGENVQMLQSQSFSNSNANPGVAYIEFKCDVTKVEFPANSTTTDHVGAFYFGTSSNQRKPYSNLKCIILSNPAQADCDGKTFRVVSGQDVFFNDISGEDDFVYASHNMVAIDSCFEKCSRCANTQLAENAQHKNTFTFYNENGTNMSYLSKIVVNSECSVCGLKEVYETIDAIFVNLGYSVEENVALGAVTHKVKINSAALDRYQTLSGSQLNYGVVAGIAGQSDDGKIITVEENKITANGNAVLADFSNNNYSIIELKITKIDKTTSVYCNAYVVENGAVTYICNNKEATEAVAQSINIVAAIPSKE